MLNLPGMWVPQIPIGPLDTYPPVRLSSVLWDDADLPRRSCKGRMVFIETNVLDRYQKKMTAVYFIVGNNAFEVRLGLWHMPLFWDVIYSSEEVKEWLFRSPSCTVIERESHGKKFLTITIATWKKMYFKGNLFQRAHPVDYAELVAEML